MSEEPRRSAISVAYDALSKAKAADTRIGAHEDLCAERYDNIHDALGEVKEQIKEMKGAQKWALGGVMGLLLSILGFLAAAQFNDNQQDRREARAKFELLQRQVAQQQAAAVPPAAPPQP